MSRDRDVKIVVGFKDQRSEINLKLPDDEPTPWDLDTKLTVAGKAHPRVEAVAKVTGRAKYTHDMNLPGMLFGGFHRSPHARADIKDIETAEAWKVPGVIVVLSDIPSLNSKRVRYAGQPLVAIAAETRQALEEAIAKVKVVYDVQPHAARLDQAMAEGAPQVHGNRPNVGELKPNPNAGKVTEALATSAKVVEAVCTTQVQNHCPLESHGAVAKWDGDHLTVWCSTQATFGVRGQIAEMLGIKASDITVITEFMGGGFGSKFGAGYHGAAAARLAKVTGRPVKVMLDRREEMTDAGNRPDSIQTMTLGVDSDGKLAAYRVEVLGTPGIGRGAGARNPMIYEFPRELVDARQAEVATNAGEQQAFRAPGHPQGSFALETIMDLAAAAAGLDPLEFRKRNDKSPVRLAQYDEGARRIGWKDRKPDGAATGRFRRGLGVGASIWYQLGGPRAEVECRIQRDGSVEVRNGAQDIGTGIRTMMAIVAAEELGLPVDRVAAFIGNTNDPIGPGSGGSTTAPSLAPAVRQAAFLAGQELRGLAAAKLACKPEELVFRDGRVVHLTDAAKALPFADACRLIQSDQISATGKRKRNFDSYQGTVAGCQFADIEVDCDFGVIRVKKIVAIQDAGLIINRLAAESQVLGGVIQGISYALFEERVMDRHLGHQVNADMEMFKIAGPKDMPEIETVLWDVSNGGNNTSTAGIGEPTSVPTASAIAGAFHNATGVRIKSLPLTPDKVLAALAGKKEDGR